MAASSRGGRTLNGVLKAPSLCSRCLSSSYSRTTARLYSAAAVTASSDAAAASTENSQIPTTPAQSSSSYDIRSGLILTRPPILTRQLHAFENSFFFYQKRLEERLNTPFITDIYFKPDTPRRLDWNLKVNERQGTVAKELGVYHGKNSTSWDDELKVGDELSNQSNIVKSLVKDAEARISDDAEIIAEKDIIPVEAPLERVTEADTKKDVKRLDRELERTLYLVVKSKDGWVFPADIVGESENLHVAAQRIIDEAAGVNMNTWIVGRVPVAHVVKQPVVLKNGTVKASGEKTFFLKGRIMAGQANIKGNPMGYTDFKWLTREELEKELAPEYFRGVRNMMADR